MRVWYIFNGHYPYSKQEKINFFKNEKINPILSTVTDVNLITS